MSNKASGTIGRSEMVPVEDFVNAFIECDGIANEVAKKLGCKASSVNTRASKLRSMGYPLPKSNRHPSPRIDREAVLALIATKTGQSVDAVKAEGDKLVAAAAERAANKET